MTTKPTAEMSLQEQLAALVARGDESWELPIPRTFLLDQQAKVRLAFVEVDYTHRLEPSTLLEGLRELAGQLEA